MHITIIGTDLILTPNKNDVCISIDDVNGAAYGKKSQSQGLVRIPKTSPSKPSLKIQKLQVL
jgi:hypothetical protein